MAERTRRMAPPHGWDMLCTGRLQTPSALFVLLRQRREPFSEKKRAGFGDILTPKALDITASP